MYCEVLHVILRSSGFLTQTLFLPSPPYLLHTTPISSLFDLTINVGYTQLLGQMRDRQLTDKVLGTQQGLYLYTNLIG
jgi:hypothetical protein